MARELNLGGTERQLSEVAKSLDRTRFDPRVGCFRSEGLRAAELRAAGVPIVRFPVTSFASMSVLEGALEMAAYVRVHRIQLVHTFDAPANIFGVPVARAAGVPCVLSSQRAWRDLVSPPQRHLLRLTDQMVDGIVVNCRAVERHMLEDERARPSALELCYNGIDTRVFHPSPRRRRPELEDCDLVVGTVCALRPEKGLETLVEAFARANWGLRPAKLVIVGDGPIRPRLQALAPHCLFQPATSEVAGWLRSIDIFVQPSLTEALSNSLMEAMACGCCVVASRVGGNPELVYDGVTGALFTPGDSAGLAEKLSLLSANPELRASLAAAASRRIGEEFTLEASIRRMSEIYLGHLERPPA